MMSYVYFANVSMCFYLIDIILNILVGSLLLKIHKHFLRWWKLFINIICNGCCMLCHKSASWFVELFPVIGLECPFQSSAFVNDIRVSILGHQSWYTFHVTSRGPVLMGELGELFPGEYNSWWTGRVLCEWCRLSHRHAGHETVGQCWASLSFSFPVCKMRINHNPTS